MFFQHLTLNPVFGEFFRVNMRRRAAADALVNGHCLLSIAMGVRACACVRGEAQHGGLCVCTCT